MNSDSMFGFGVIIVVLLGLGGWIANIVKLFTTDAALAEWTVMEISRIVGVFLWPIGCVLGYF